MTPKEMIEAGAKGAYEAHREPGDPSWDELSEPERNGYRTLAQGALTAALSVQWRGMESAPKDGTKIDLMFPGVRGRTINYFWMNDKVHHGWVWLTPTWDKGELLPESKWMVNCYPEHGADRVDAPPPAPRSGIEEAAEDI